MALKPKNGSKLDITLPDPQPIEYWWEPGNSPASIEEERGLSEYDCGYLDLGTESPASTSTLNLMESSGFLENRAAGVTLHAPTRRPSSRRSPPAINHPSKFNKSGVDRDCGICFEYAVVPCRTLCCGKIFCTEHLADWLHGPNAEGRCPNCENACSLEGGTLSLASPISPSSSHGRRNNLTQSIQPSPLFLLQHHSNDTLATSRDRLHPQAAATLMKNSLSSSVTRTSSTCSSTVDYSEATVSTEDSKTTGEQRHIHHTFQKERPLTSSFSPSWGVVSRLFSIVIFLMFLYKLRS